MITSGTAAIAASSYHSMALKQDDTVWAAGSNAYNQLGYRGTYEEEDITNFVLVEISDGAFQDDFVAIVA